MKANMHKIFSPAAAVSRHNATQLFHTTIFFPCAEFYGRKISVHTHTSVGLMENLLFFHTVLVWQIKNGDRLIPNICNSPRPRQFILLHSVRKNYYTRQITGFHNFLHPPIFEALRKSGFSKLIQEISAV